MEKKFFFNDPSYQHICIFTWFFSYLSVQKKKNWFVLIALRFTFTYIKILIKCSLVAAFFVTESRVDI